MGNNDENNKIAFFRQVAQLARGNAYIIGLPAGKKDRYNLLHPIPFF